MSERHHAVSACSSSSPAVRIISGSGSRCIALHDDGIELKATWREEWVVNPERRYTHGGMLAALVDLGADWAMVKKLGRPVPTIDLRVDYHAAAMPGDLTVRGKIVRMGSQFSSAEAHILDDKGKLSPAAAAPISPRRRRADSICLHVEFTNLGDLIRRDRDLTKSPSSISAASRRRANSPIAQLDAMANGVARALTRRGLARGDRVGILSANRAEFLAAYFGIMRAGFVAVPVNFKFPRQTIHFILRDAGAKLVFCDPQRREIVPADFHRCISATMAPTRAL